jgi:hypothetical protein
MKCPVCNRKLNYFDLRAKFQCECCKSVLSINTLSITTVISLSWFLLAILIYDFVDSIFLIILLDLALGIGITLISLEYFGVKHIKETEDNTLKHE